MPLFKDRADAGRQLGDRLAVLGITDNPIVLGLPRGGVAVAGALARRLGWPLDIIVVRKLGLPGHEAIAMGAIAAGGVRVLDRVVVSTYGVTRAALNKVIEQEQVELDNRELLFRGRRAAAPIQKRTVVLVDDGLTAGVAVRAAVRAIRREKPSAVIVALPVAAPWICDDFEGDVDGIVAIHAPKWFTGVGDWYEDFHRLSQEEVRVVLREATVRG